MFHDSGSQVLSQLDEAGKLNHNISTVESEK
jgi:hypothetical protein